MKLNFKETKWLRNPSAQKLSKLYKSFGYQVLFVGGCVRNTILKMPVTDIDLATDAQPEEIIKIAKENNIRFVPTGLAHGTITLIIDNKNYQITTFRTDFDHDGRYAKVEFTESLLLDASRRDLTINALYCNHVGEVIDPLNGLDDIKKQKIKFIGNPNERIKEDNLRILRFFRFQAIYGNKNLEIDSIALEACHNHKSKLAALSKERITSELRKILSAPNPLEVIIKMNETGVLNELFQNVSIDSLEAYLKTEEKFKININWLGRLLSLQVTQEEESLKLTRCEFKFLKQTKSAIENQIHVLEFSYYNGVENGKIYSILQNFRHNIILCKNLLNQINSLATKKFPITAKDLMPEIRGKKLGEALRSLEDRWIKSNFTLSKKDLLAEA
ncbi:MAG: CCA tRNA nucleotidyltransferase [Paracoccaceae bacterium]|nr:CCA tRNA nucleotidyltransferase [Paracoccaceae bacterium]